MCVQNKNIKFLNNIKPTPFYTTTFFLFAQYPEGTLDANTAVADAANGGANANAPGTEDNEVRSQTQTGQTQTDTDRVLHYTIYEHSNSKHVLVLKTLLKKTSTVPSSTTRPLNWPLASPQSRSRLR